MEFQQFFQEIANNLYKKKSLIDHFKSKAKFPANLGARVSEVTQFFLDDLYSDNSFFPLELHNDDDKLSYLFLRFLRESSQNPRHILMLYPYEIMAFDSQKKVQQDSTPGSFVFRSHSVDQSIEQIASYFSRHSDLVIFQCLHLNSPSNKLIRELFKYKSPYYYISIPRDSAQSTRPLIIDRMKDSYNHKQFSYGNRSFYCLQRYS